MSRNGEALRLDGVHKSFGKLEVLKGIDLSVADHEVICLIGASGSGKSTMLRCVNLLEPVDAGRITVRGEEITAPGVDVNRIRRHIGIVFQAFNLFPHMTVLRNVTLAPHGRRWACRRTEAQARALELLERFGLADKRDEYPDRLSGRPTATRGHRPGPGHAARHHAARRGHERPGPRAGGRGPERDPRAGGRWHDHGHRHPRDGLRPRHRPRVCFLDAGRILEEGPPERIFSEPREERTRRFLQSIIDAGRM